MILKPRLEDARNIGYYLGKVIIGLGLTMCIPVLIGLVCRESNPVYDFVIAAEAALILGLTLKTVCQSDKELTWMQGMIVVSLSWIAAMVLGAIPFYLSGHWRSYLDACFDAMSGFATTGLVLVGDLDHLSYTHNFWRHLTMFIGGQGIVVVALSFFIKGASGAFKMYVGEAREERILPNVVHTSRFIWLVSLVYLVIGTGALAFIARAGGMRLGRALFHGAYVFMAAFDTGGFCPQSQSILYYHSFAFEIATIVIMILGALNFKLHYHIWTGNRKEIFRNIETATFFITVLSTFLVTSVSLAQTGIYKGAVVLFRKGFYQLISGHTGTGFQTIHPEQFAREWNNLAVVGVLCGMALGGAVCSTTGAIKMLRLGILSKAMVQDIKRIILPERAIVVKKFHHIRDTFLQDSHVRPALLITLAYLFLYGAGALIGMFFGYPFLNALFESTSAAANVGLSCGITSAAMPALLKVTYIIQMWAGRLEFMSVFTLIGFLVAAIKGK